MKAKVTRKELSRHYDCIAVGYCQLQHLLTFESPRFYHAGVYGWNFDAYVLNHGNRTICITTGYRSMINNCSYKNPWQLSDEYDKKAAEIQSSRIGQDEIRRQTEALLDEYLSKVMGE